MNRLPNVDFRLPIEESPLPNRWRHLSKAPDSQERNIDLNCHCEEQRDVATEHSDIFHSRGTYVLQQTSPWVAAVGYRLLRNDKRDTSLIDNQQLKHGIFKQTFWA